VDKKHHVLNGGPVIGHYLHPLKKDWHGGCSLPAWKECHSQKPLSMDNALNTIQNKALAALTAGAPQKVVSAIRQASARTGVNFAYLVQQAGAESSFNPRVKARTSSASGLYQFIESTWLSMVK